MLLGCNGPAAWRPPATAPACLQHVSFKRNNCAMRRSTASPLRATCAGCARRLSRWVGAAGVACPGGSPARALHLRPVARLPPNPVPAGLPPLPTEAWQARAPGAGAQAAAPDGRGVGPPLQRLDLPLHGWGAAGGRPEPAGCLRLVQRPLHKPAPLMLLDRPALPACTRPPPPIHRRRRLGHPAHHEDAGTPRQRGSCHDAAQPRLHGPVPGEISYFFCAVLHSLHGPSQPTTHTCCLLPHPAPPNLQAFGAVGSYLAGREWGRRLLLSYPRLFSAGAPRLLHCWSQQLPVLCVSRPAACSQSSGGLVPFSCFLAASPCRHVHA